MKILKQVYKSPEIEKKREELKSAVIVYGLDNPIVINLSQELDRLIIKSIMDRVRENS